MNNNCEAGKTIIEKERESMAVLHLNRNNFDSEVLKSDKPVLVDFWAEWCGPCQMMAPVVEELSDECKDVKVAKLNVDEESTLAMQYRIVSIPTLVLFKNGKVVKHSVGFTSKEEILDMIK